MREKLIRDRIPEIAQAEGRTLAVRSAGAPEWDRLLGLKLVEETHEVIGALASGDRTDLLEELADLQAVLDEVARRNNFSKTDVDLRARAKRAERGGFDHGVVLREAAVRDPRLHIGGSATLLDAIRHEFEACAVARIAVAFVMRSGIDLFEGPALAALLRGAEIRMTNIAWAVIPINALRTGRPRLHHSCGPGVEQLRFWQLHQCLGLFPPAVQPGIDVLELDRHDRALVLHLRRPLGIRPVHAAHQRVRIGVVGEHGVALDQFAGLRVDPDVPQSHQAPGQIIGAAEDPRRMLAALPVGLEEGPGRDDAALSAGPGLLVGGLCHRLLGPRIAGRVRDQAPTAVQVPVDGSGGMATGTLAWPMRVGGNRLVVLAPLHVMSPLPDLQRKGRRAGALGRALDAQARPQNGAVLFTTLDAGGHLLPWPNPSFDAQLGAVHDQAGLQSAFQGFRISSSRPFLRSAGEVLQASAGAGLQILVPDNLPRFWGAKRKLLAAYSRNITKETPLIYRVAGGLEAYVAHVLLIELQIKSGNRTWEGDSGSAVITPAPDGAYTLAGMHIAGSDKGLAFMLPAWQLFDPLFYQSMPEGSIEPVST